MEKLYTCIGCSKNFKVLSKSDYSIYRQHEVEMNVECPFCSKTNAIVWPQGEFALVKSASGDFYVQDTCCISCGVPQAIAPDLVGWTNENLTQCFWLKQPQTADELDRAIKIIHSQELGCHRYSGKDPAILQRLPAEDCDHFRPDLKLHGTPLLRSSGVEPKFTLSASIKHSAFIRLWRTMLRK
jgi:hypothetical protein